MKKRSKKKVGRRRGAPHTVRYRGWEIVTAKRGDGRWDAGANRSFAKVKGADIPEVIPSTRRGFETRETGVRAVKARIDRRVNPRASISKLPARTLRQAPIGLEGAELAELGSVLELETDTATIRWPRGRAVLGWSPRHKALVVLEGAKRKRNASEPRGRARAAFERWARRGAKHGDELELAPRGSWRRLGALRRIDYHSDKWGRKAEYTHPTGRGVTLYMRGSWDAPPRVWVIKGGRLTVSERGIIN